MNCLWPHKLSHQKNKKMAPLPIPSTCFSGEAENDFKLFPCYEQICPDLRSLFKPREFYLAHQEIMAKEDAANLERAKYAKECRAFSPYELQHLSRNAKGGQYDCLVSRSN